MDVQTGILEYPTAIQQGIRPHERLISELFSNNDTQSIYLPKFAVEKTRGL